MAEAGLLAGLELVVWLVLVLVHILQEVWSRGQRGWMRKIGVNHNTQLLLFISLIQLKSLVVAHCS